MLRREFVVRVVRRGFYCATAASLSGCGTFFHKERIGQPHSYQIDWRVAAADGLGLLLFFIPGIVAFVVDFYTGAIYLPCDYCAANGEDAGTTPGEPAKALATDAIATSGGVEFARIDLPREKLDPRSIEDAVSARVGRSVELVGSEGRASELEALDQFAIQRRKHDENRGFGRTIRSLLTGVA
jgi:hypothetical protein